MNKSFRGLPCALLLLIWPMASLHAQSSSSPQQSPPPQPPPAQAQTPAQPKEESVADAAKKSQKDKPKPKKVYTEDDLSGAHKGGISVVGNDNKKNPRRVRNSNPDNPDGDYDPNSEEFWRGRSQPILDEIAATDQAIEQLKEDIKKFGSGGFDVTTGMKDNVAYIHDRNGQIQDLQNKKADLQKQLDELAEEGRKAGAQPAWFR